MRTWKSSRASLWKRHGTFVTPGKPDYRAVFHLSAAPNAASVGGKAADGDWDSEAKTFTIALGAIPVAGCTVEIKASSDAF